MNKRMMTQAIGLVVWTELGASTACSLRLRRPSGAHQAGWRNAKRLPGVHVVVYTAIVVALKRSLLARVFVLILLGWTGVDLVAPQLCAADQTGSIGLASLSVAPSQAVPNNAAGGDCFCCATNVLPSQITYVTDGAVVVSSLPLAVVNHVHVLARTLYHPPQLFS